MTAQTAAPEADDRVVAKGRAGLLFARPEVGALIGALAVMALFLAVAPSFRSLGNTGTILYEASAIGVMAVGVSLLMVGGEFDLSTGVAATASGICAALTAWNFGLNVWVGVLAALLFSLLVGAFNGWLLMRTGLPSFIVTLAFLFILRGFTIYLPQIIERKTIIGGVDRAAEGDWFAALFGGKILTGFFAWMGDAGIIDVFERGSRAGQPVVEGIPMLIVWAIALVIVGHIILTRTQFGNWIFAAGGDAQAARYVGVPVNRVKILMFMFTAFCATVFATCQVMEFGSAGADRGLLKEFEAIIAVVIGGALLTGGYGSVIGAALGALIFGVVQQGLFFAGVESSLFRVFLGVILLFAVILNTYIRRIITGER